MEMNIMVKYIQIAVNDADVKIVDTNYCLYCKYYEAPSWCGRGRGYTVPFTTCDGWVEATEDKLQETKDKVNECCDENMIGDIRRRKEFIDSCKEDICDNINRLIELLDNESEYYG